MASSWAQQIAHGTQSQTNYNSLNLQSRYLLESLANQEARGERLANLLEVTKVQLDVAKSSGNDADNIKSLKKKMKNLAYKLTSNQKTEKSLADNLALLTARMNLMEQTQWRRANFEYNQSLQYGQLDGLAADMQNTGLVSPITPGFLSPSYSSGYASPISPMFMQPWAASYPAPVESYQMFPPTLQPYHSLPYGQSTSQQPPANASSHDEFFDDSDATMQVDTQVFPLRFPVQDFVPTRRALSLPDISTTQHLSPSTKNITSIKEPPGGESMGLKRQLNLANRGSSALRLPRKFP